jgi:sensor histidine kinase YesM
MHITKYWLYFECFFFGILFVQIIYVFFQYYMLRRFEFLYYALYMVSFGAYFIADTLDIIENPETYRVDKGIGFQHYNFLMILAYFCYYRFFRYIFNLKETLPKWYPWFIRIENTLIAYIIFHLVISIFGADAKTITLCYTIFTLTIFVISMYLARQIYLLRTPLTKIIILGTTIFTVGSVINLILAQIYPDAYTRPWCMDIGITLEIFFLTFALSRQTKKLEEEKQQFQKRFSEMQITALRSQMNPHFIFNCMNTLDSFILSNQADAASHYLQQFSKLTRLVLENSRTSFVTLDQDLKALKLYIALEMERNKYRFTSEIEISPDIDLHNYLIPPLLLQPYVENAILHGLKKTKDAQPVESKIYIKIDTTSIPEIDKPLLYCLISDNGIGIGNIAPKENKISLGMQVTSERLETIYYGHTPKAEVKISFADKINQTGTNVELFLPLLSQIAVAGTV